MIPVLGNIAQAERLSWVKQAGGAELDTSGSLAVDGSGNIYVTGYFEGTATFGEGTTQTTLTSRGSSDIFLAKYSTDGTLAWAIQAGGTSDDYSFGIAFDGSGNSYLTGAFLSTDTIFGEGASQTTLTTRGGHDIFVAKYATDGTLAWVKQAGGVSDNYGWGIAVDGSGNSYVTSWSGTATFGEGVTQTTLTTRGTIDIFLAKYGTDGTLAWVKQAGGERIDWIPTIAVDGSGNSYLTGSFTSTNAIFGEGASQTTLTTRGGQDIFVAKYATDGTLAWAIQAGGADTEYGGEITVDASGNSYVTGEFHGTATFGEDATQTTLTSRGGGDIFLAKYATDGTLAWVKQAGGTDFEFGNGIAVDGSGNSYVTGPFTGEAIFGEGASQTILNSSAGSTDNFVAKYAADGSLAWVKQAGGTDNDYGESIAVAGYWNIYVTGGFGGTATFGEDATQTTLTSRGSSDIFVAKYVSGEEATPAGPEVPSVPTDTTTGGTPVMVTFDQVDGEGVTTLTTTTGGTPPPTGFALGDPPTYYDIETTASFTGNLQICIDYSGVSYGDESSLRLFYDGPGGLEDITDPGYPDTENNVICGTTSHLSTYVIMEKKAYQFVGFFDPVQTGPEVVNLVKAGSIIPVKWQLQNQNGGTIDDLSVVTGTYIKMMECSDSSLLTYLGDTITSGSSGLRYDYSSNQFIYNWKTTKNMAGKCYRLDVKLFGSDVYSADFQMW